MEHQKNVGFPLHDWDNLISIRTFSLHLLEDMPQKFKEECLKEYEKGLVFDSLTFRSLDDDFPFIIIFRMKAKGLTYDSDKKDDLALVAFEALRRACKKT